MLAGNVVSGWQMARSLLAAERHLAAGTDPDFMRAKIATARFYGDHILSKVPGIRHSIVEGAVGVTSMPVESLEARCCRPSDRRWWGVPRTLRRRRLVHRTSRSPSCRCPPP